MQVGDYMGVGRWNCRKTIGFRSEEHYAEIRRTASERGLTVARYLSWLDEVYRRVDQSEPPLLSDEEEMKQLTVRMSKDDLSLLKRCSKGLGMSANSYMVRLLREDSGKVNTWSVPDRQSELRLVMDIEAKIVNFNSKEALEALQKLKALIVDSQVKV
jgi:predicted DNA binding CopG/RHH family protein